MFLSVSCCMLSIGNLKPDHSHIISSIKKTKSFTLKIPTSFALIISSIGIRYSTRYFAGPLHPERHILWYGFNKTCVLLVFL